MNLKKKKSEPLFHLCFDAFKIYFKKIFSDFEAQMSLISY